MGTARSDKPEKGSQTTQQNLRLELSFLFDNKKIKHYLAAQLYSDVLANSTWPSHVNCRNLAGRIPPRRTRSLLYTATAQNAAGRGPPFIHQAFS